MSTPRPARVVLALALAAAALPGCSLTTGGELSTYAGEWCLLRGLGSGGLPRTADAHIGMTLVQEGSLVVGTGSTKWPGSDVIHMSRFQGTVEGDKAVVQVSDLDPASVREPGPLFVLELRIEGSRDLIGVASGDPGFAGTHNFVRLGPRCFFE
jgi:hypothetical protein